jgi:hypothetical protein
MPSTLAHAEIRHIPHLPDPPLMPPPPTMTVAPPPSPGPPHPPGAAPEDKERQLALSSDPGAKAALKNQLERKVYSGRGTDAEMSLLIETCKSLGDKLCVAKVRELRAQRQ